MKKTGIGLALGITLGSLVVASIGRAQSIRPAADGTGTRVRMEGDRYRITGGQTSRDGANLFHSFEDFGLTADEIAVFRSRTEIDNILGRVTGGDASYINGLLRVLGSDANLFLMNPAGIVFGENARLDLGGSFTATTATGIGFAAGWFDVVGTPDYANLVGAPERYAFAGEQPGAIANYGNLAAPGDVTLLAGTLVNTGGLTTPDGTLTLATVPGSSRVRLTQAGSLLSLEVETDGLPQLVDDPLALPALLTGGPIAPPAPLTVASDQVQLDARTAIAAGDVAIASALGLQAETAVVTAAADLTVLDTAIVAADNLGLLAGDTVRLRDSEAAPLRAIAGTELQVQGNQTVDIFALNHPDSGLAAGGDLVLRSPQPVLGDAHYVSGGNFRIERLNGRLGDLLSPFDPVIRSRGDVSFASYTGASLHVIAGGTVRVPGTITITGADNTTGLEERVTLSNDRTILIDGRERPTLDLRAGVTDVGATSIVGAPRPPELDLNPGEAPTGADITIGNARITAPNGLVFLSTQYRPNAALSGGNIRIQNATGIETNGGDLIIDARGGVRSAGTLDTRNVGGDGGNVQVLANGGITLGLEAETGVLTTGGEAGNVQLIGRNGTVQLDGGLRAVGNTGTGGNVQIEAGDRIQVSGLVATNTVGGSATDAAAAASGDVVMRAAGQLDTGRIDTTSANGRGGSVILASTFEAVRTEAINTRGPVGGDIELEANGDLTVGNLTTGTAPSQIAGSLSLFSTQGDVAGAEVRAVASQQGGSLQVDAPFAETIRFEDITATGEQGGQVFIVSNLGQVTLSNVDVSGTTTGGTIDVVGDDIFGGNLIARGRDGTGGDVVLNSALDITVGDVSVSGEDGGDLTLIAADLLETGRLSARGTGGDGGDVVLETTADIDAVSIDARGGAFGVGGNVEVTTTGFVRISGAIADEAIGAPASITTSAFFGQGSILINHGGFVAEEPFIVGDPLVNGTAEAITTGDDTLFPVEVFDADIFQGDIAILTTDVDDFFFDDEFEDSLDEDFEDEEFDEFGGVLFDTVAVESFGEEFYTDLEGEFSGEFADYLDLAEGAVASVDDAQATLNTVAQATGVRPALLYVNFVPVVFGATDRAEDVLELVLITPGDQPLRKRVLGATRSQVLEVANQFRQEVTNPIRTRTTSYLPYAQQLYDWLIAPLVSELQAEEVETLSFVLPTGLRSLPIAALHDGERFLVERYSVGLMPSLSLVDTRYRNIQDNQVLAMGASEFADQFPLPAVPFEVEEIANAIWDGEAFLNQDFTLQTLLQQRRDTPFGIVHLATHGEFRAGELSNSYIQFWDQRLQLDQLRQLNLNDPPVNLLVLSACRMALGDAEAELGFAGLAVQAGVQTALASLWYVSDAGTLALMTEFYRALRENPTKAEALRTAQIAMIRGEVQLADNSLVSRGMPAIALPADLLKGDSPNLSHPYYWSAFTLIGSPW